VDVQHVSVGAQLPGQAAARRAGIARLSGQSDAEIAAEVLAMGGYTDLGELDCVRIAAAYRHDCVSAHTYIAGALEHPPAARLTVPVTVVLAADDPYTADSADRYLDWSLFAEAVSRRELADGGHYFLRTRPALAAGAVLAAVSVTA
jgi:surfactin synthase thioesterase subunit